MDVKVQQVQFLEIHSLPESGNKMCENKWPYIPSEISDLRCMTQKHQCTNHMKGAEGCLVGFLAVDSHWVQVYGDQPTAVQVCSDLLHTGGRLAE